MSHQLQPQTLCDHLKRDHLERVEEIVNACRVSMKWYGRCIVEHPQFEGFVDFAPFIQLFAKEPEADPQTTKERIANRVWQLIKDNKRILDQANFIQRFISGLFFLSYNKWDPKISSSLILQEWPSRLR